MSTAAQPDDNLVHDLVLSLYQAVEHPHLWTAWLAEHAHRVETHPVLVRHVRQAERLQKSMAGSSTDRTINQSVLDRIPVPVVIVDRDGGPIRANAAANHLANASAPVTFARAGIDVGTADLNRQLVAAIRSVTADARSAPQEVALSLIRANQAPLHVLITSVPTGNGAAHDGAAACLFIADPNCEVLSDADRLKRLFHFTPAEARVAVGLANGCAVTQLAERLGLSRNTVRWHVKHVLQKAGVKSQTQFVCLIHRSPAGLL